MKTVFSLVLILITPLLYAAGNSITYTSDGEEYEGYFVSPTRNAPLVILVHDWDGLTDYEVKRSQMLADIGYAVFAVDLFGKGVRPTDIKDKMSLTGSLYKNRQKMRKLLYAGIDAAKSQGANMNQVVAAGYCFGGAAVLELARSGADLKGFVTFHGGLSKPEGQDYQQTKGKLIIFHGSADTAVTMNDFSQLAGDLEKANIPHEMTSYSGAPHAFTVFGAPSYRKDADTKSWKRFAEFLDETLK